MLATLLALQIAAAGAGPDPFAFLRPTVVISADERQRLDRGEPIARILPADDREVAVMAAARVRVDEARFVAWMRRIEQLKKSSYVLGIGRFSDPPALQDLAALTLDDRDLQELRACRPGACGVKLVAGEIARLRAADADAAAAARDWRPAITQAFREIVFARLTRYLATGEIASYEERPGQAPSGERFRGLVDHSTFLVERFPGLAAHLRNGLSPPPPGAESFVYWSNERLAGKPVFSLTQVHMVRSGGPAMRGVVAAGTQIFATHYYDASLGITMLVRGAPGGHNYLVYVNRSSVDVLGGAFGGLTRWMVQRRIRSESAAVLRGLAERLESGEPPPEAAAAPR